MFELCRVVTKVTKRTLGKPQAGIAPISDGATSDAVGFAEPAHVDSIDLERDSAIRVLGTHGSRCSLGSPVS